MLFKEKADQVSSLMLGKIKAALLIIALLLLLASTVWPVLRPAGGWLLYTSTLFALIS
jgi:phosphatidylglycerophosphate synthase